MTSIEWLTKVDKAQIVLRDLISEYYPQTAPHAHRDGKLPMPITASGAEAACARVRTLIAVETADKPDPETRFNTALATGDIPEIYSLLSGAWFGVPESTSCWNITGFNEAVDLMDDMPDPPDDMPDPEETQ